MDATKTEMRVRRLPHLSTEERCSYAECEERGQEKELSLLMTTTVYRIHVGAPCAMEVERKRGGFQLVGRHFFLSRTVKIWAF